MACSVQCALEHALWLYCCSSACCQLRVTCQCTATLTNADLMVQFSSGTCRECQRSAWSSRKGECFAPPSALEPGMAVKLAGKGEDCGHFILLAQSTSHTASHLPIWHVINAEKLCPQLCCASSAAIVTADTEQIRSLPGLQLFPQPARIMLTALTWQIAANAALRLQQQLSEAASLPSACGAAERSFRAACERLKSCVNASAPDASKVQGIHSAHAELVACVGKWWLRLSAAQAARDESNV